MALADLFRRSPSRAVAAEPPPAPERRLVAELDDAAARKDGEAVEAALTALRAITDLPSFELAVAGIHLRHADLPALAEGMFAEAVAREPACALAHHELALLHVWDGRRHAAVAALEQAVAAAPHYFPYRFLLAHMLYASDARAEAQAQLALLEPRSPSERARVEVLQSFGDYLGAFPQARGQSLIQEVRRRYRWIEVETLAEQIGSAVEERRPFALIRLGDGEGAFAEVDAEDEARFAPLYRWMRRDWVRFLFGPDLDPDASGYTALTRTLMQTVAEADVLGVPYPSWIHHEYGISSLRGLPCLLNIHRNLLAGAPAGAAAGAPMLCDQIVHIVLHNRGLIEPILRRARRLTVISCLVGLDDLIRRRFELEEVELLAVPREHVAPHLRAAEHVAGAAFPDAYEAVMRKLATPHGGRVFLIAAGTLGKFYAVQIKRHGGIALDLGSLVDGWMRLPSRAGYDDSLAL